jgi:hypothetical protein
VSSFDDLERRLRAERPEPSDALVHAVVGGLAAGMRPRRRPSLRLALAASFSIAMLTAATALGAAGGVTQAAESVVATVAHATTPPATPPPTVAPASSGNGNGNSSPPAAVTSSSSNDKVTLCHATGSSTNPFVEITVSANGLAGHGGHSDDIIPAPSGGCPTASPGDDQYRPGKGCGDKNHVHSRENECKKEK